MGKSENRYFRRASDQQVDWNLDTLGRRGLTIKIILFKQVCTPMYAQGDTN